MYRTILLGLLFLGASIHSSAQKILVSEVPSWVETTDVSLNKKRELQVGEGFRYLLFERQVDLHAQESYHRYSVQVLSSDGVKDNSDIQVNYDPTFQKLIFHEASIYRNGAKINKLQAEDFRLIQKETSADRHIYDGQLSALLHLSDVQKNDIIDVSYSIQGFNPVYGKDFSGFLYHQFGMKVEKFHYKLLVPKDKPLKIHTNGHAHQPMKLSENGKDVYRWSHDGLVPISFDNNLPYWSAMYPMTSYSTFQDWGSVVNWALPLYKYSEDGISELKKHLPSDRENIARITNIIRYVQDDIRYLGLESGMSAYRPNSPQKVFNQKYGDCKDKSLLLVALLRSEGIEAYPVLVNTDWKSNLKHFDANASAFDHCIVNYKWRGEDFYVDPTISDQGGNLSNIYFPDYRMGLVLKPGNTSLTTFPEVKKPFQKVEEFIFVENLEGDATLQIKTEYRGRRADEIRARFSNSTVEEIAKSYTDFYSGIFQGIATSHPIEFLDSDRNVSNVVTTLENYTIEGFWSKSDTDEDQMYAEIYPIELNSRLGFPQTANRKTDYFLGEPEEFSLTTKIVMPEFWPVTDSKKRIDAGAFVYENEVSSEGNIIEIKHRYELLKASIPGEEIAGLIEKKNLVNNELAFFLTYSPDGGSSLSYPAFALGILILATCLLLGVRIYKNYNPEPQSQTLHDGIGGWLVIPSLTIIAIPLTTIYTLLTTGYFTTALWDGAALYGTALEIFCGVSFVFMILFFSYSVLTLIFFFKLRTAAPQMFIFLIVINFVASLLEVYVADQYFHDLETDSSYPDAFRSLIGLFIWVPYFVKSTRVKSTFTRTYSPKRLQMVLADKEQFHEEKL